MKSLTALVPNRGIVPKLRFKEYSEKWKETPFSDVGIFLKGKGISKDQLTEEGTQCILYGELYTKYKNEIIKEVFSKTSIDPKGLVVSKNNDVIIPSSGETAIDIATACCVNLDGVLLGGDLNIIRPDKDNGNFISYQLNGKRKQDIAKIAQGSSVTHLYNDSLKKLKIFLPEDRDEQDKIATFLSLIDQRIATQSKIIENLKTLIKITSEKIFTQKLRFKDDFGNDFPGWEVKKLEDVCEIAKSGGTPTSTNKSYYNGDIPFLSISDMTSQGKYLTKTSNSISKLGLENSSSWLVPQYSLIYSMYASVGFVAINKIPIATSQAVLNLILKKEFNLEFMYYTLIDFQKKIAQFITTGTQGNLNAQSVKNFNISIPSFSEQTKIAEFLSQIDEKIETEKKLLTQYENQKKYLLQNLFI